MARRGAGETVRSVAEALSVAPSSVVKWSQRLRSTGSAAPGKIGGHVLPKIRGEDTEWLRARWQASQGSIDLTRLVFLDETWANTNMAPLRGWGPRGQRLIGCASLGHWNTMTFIAALRHDGIVAPFVLDGPINGENFRTYAEHVLIPIEQVIAKLKHLLRKAAERTKEVVWRRIGSLLDLFSPRECENYIRNAGYGSM